MALWSHWPQEYFNSSWTVVLCLVRSPFVVASKYLRDSGNNFCAEQDDPLKLPYSHIGCKVSSTLHVLFLCVEQDYPFKSPFGHIGCKSTSTIHELCYCVEQYYPLKLPYGHIASKVTSPFVKCYFVLSNTIAPDSSPFLCISCLNLVITFTSFRPPLSFSCIIIAHAPKPLSVIMWHTFFFNFRVGALFFLDSVWKGVSYLKPL